MTAVQYNVDSMTRLIGSAAKLQAGAVVAEVDTFARQGTLTLASGQVFRFTVEELDAGVVAAKAAERPGQPGETG